MQCLRRVRRTEYRSKSEGDIQSDVGSGGDEGQGEESKGDQRAQCPILNNLRADHRVRQQSPESRCYDASMNRGEDGESSGALLEESTGGQELQHEGEEVEDEEYAEFGSSDCGFAPAGDKDEVENKDDAEAAGDDVGYVGERAICADEEDAALGIHANRSDFWVSRRALEDRGGVML